MDILIIGGTIFLGKHIINSALKQSHNVTIFNRGIHNPDWFPELEKIKGDREISLESLRGRKFDAVVDTCGYVPGVVKRSAEFLKDSVGYYTFISSISVYKDASVIGLNENSETAEITDGNVETWNLENYGAMKVLCENEVNKVFGNDCSMVRSGLIVGDGDFSDRFTYWVERISKGGKIIVPNRKINNVQFIDVKDLADWTIKMTEEKIPGVYNSTGNIYTFVEFTEKIKRYVKSDAEFIFMDEEFLLEVNVVPFKEITLWLSDEDAGINNIDVSKARSAGLKIRPLEETIQDTIEYHSSRGKNFKLRTGLSREKELEVLEKWERVKEN